jgi:hypothetical protein
MTQGEEGQRVQPPRRGQGSVSLMEAEPFVTIRGEPRRFAVGLPLVFGGSIAIGVGLASIHLSLGMAALLVIQTAGLLALYIPALRRRLKAERGARAEVGFVAAEASADAPVPADAPGPAVGPVPAAAQGSAATPKNPDVARTPNPEEEP